MEQEGQARDSASQTPGAERRAAPRLPSTLKLTCYPVGGGLMERRQARIRNVSRTGVGLVVDRAWPVGTTLLIELPAVEEAVKTVRVKVIHSTPQMGGMMLVGCSFENQLTDAEVQALAR
jgi:hypothetical protein